MRIEVDASKPLAQEPSSGHNRWHPDIEPIARVKQDEEITIEARDGLDGQLTEASAHADAGSLDFAVGHPLTGPVYVDGASPGDVLEVELVSFEPADFGFAALIPGFGFLADIFTEPFLAKFELKDGFARSPELPGVSIPADMLPGCIGIAPSHEMLADIRQREDELKERGGAVADQMPEAAVPALAADGIRTIPPRELGGNMDVRGLVAGSRVQFPVQVPGALFSIGDLHFAQGDGETCGTGIEMAGAATARFRVIKNPAWRPRFPAYFTPEQRPRQTFATTGISLADDGTNEEMDFMLATRRAILEMIDWLGSERGLTREAAYILVSIAVDLRLSEIVDVPNPMVSAVVPLDIFAEPTVRAVVQGRRRREAMGRLVTERRQEASLSRRLDNARRAAEAWRMDAAASALLDSESLAILQETSFLSQEPDDETKSRLDGRVDELEVELEESRRKQRALNAYAAALDQL